MTVKNQNKAEQTDMEDILRALFERKELTAEQISRLEMEGVKYTNLESPQDKEILGEKMIDFLKRIELPPGYFAKNPHEKLNAVKKVYLDFKEGQSNKPSDIWRYASKGSRNDYFFFGFVLIETANPQENCKIYWRPACDLMSRVTRNNKYLDDYDIPKKRKRLYKMGTKYINIYIEAHELKEDTDNKLERQRNEEEIWNNIILQLYPDIRKELPQRYDENFSKRIHSYLAECSQKERKEIPIGKLYDHFSNKRRRDIFPCLRILERVGEIFFDMKNKKIYYLGSGKDLKDSIPSEDYFIFFNRKRVIKSFVDHFRNNSA